MIEENTRIKTIILLFLITLTLTVYWPVQNYEFLNYDDQIYVTDNLRVRFGLSWDNLAWAFKSMDAGFWHPLTWLSLMSDYSLYRMGAGGYHWTNVLFHVGSTFVLFLALHAMTGAIWRSGFVAALFAVHPLHVESVAWIAERKDVLSGFFWMLTLWMYVHYVKKPRLGKYLVVLLSFILGLMSKPMVVTLPVVLLLMDYWPLGRFNSLEKQKNTLRLVILEKVPLLICSSVIGILTVIAEHRFGAISDLETLSLTARISNALVSYMIYIGDMIFPAKLAAYYPHPGFWPLPTILGAGLFIAFLTLFSVTRAKKSPYLIVGWLWYLMTLGPVIGLIQLGNLARADRYTYIPLVGLFIAFAWSVSELFKKMNINKSILLSSAVAVLLVFAVIARFQVQYWKNDLTLFNHMVNVTENNYKAYHGLGMVYHKQGDDERAIAYIRQALTIKPDNRAHNDLGFVYMSKGKFMDAEKEFSEAVRLNPGNVKAHNNLGAALASQGNYKEAIGHFREAIRLDPNYTSARLNMKNALQYNDSLKETLRP